MKKSKLGVQEGGRYFVGLDWGESGHAVAVVDERRRVVDQFDVGPELEELRRLVERLKGMGTIAGIAVEATCHPVRDYLVCLGFAVYSVNPKMSKSWRESNSVAGVKSDRRDSLVLAMELACRYESLHPLKPEDPGVAELAGLCEKQRQLIDIRTAQLQRLKATLRQYYRGALDFFTEWTSPVAWRFLQRFPNPEALARARKDTLIKFLKANHVPLRPRWLERIEQRGQATQWPVPADHLALETLALATVAQLQALQAYLDKYDRLIAERMTAVPEARLMESLPGAGQRLAPALTAITALVAGEQDRYQSLRCLSGAAPVEASSGKHSRIQMRRRCNKHWRNTLHLFAHCSTRSCAWAKAFYDMHRQRGDTHAGALRKLADKWLKIISGMLATGEPYDDQRYVEALRENGSPVYLRLCEKTSG